MFRFLFYTVIAYVIFRWLDRMFRGTPKNKQNQNKYNKSEKKEDITSTKQTKSVIKDDVGEYVDFEDLDEKKK